MKTISYQIFMPLLLLFFGLSMAQTAVAPSAGDGSEVNPYQIATLENLCWVAYGNEDISRWSKHYIQTADIDASSTFSWYDGIGWPPIGGHWATGEYVGFTGVYDGDHHIISGLYHDFTAQTSQEYFTSGLFGYVGDGGIVKNIGLIDVNITGHQYVGGLAGANMGTISNCCTTGVVKAYDNAGGLVGYTFEDVTPASVSDCYSRADVIRISGTGTAFGGFVGSDFNASINRSYSTGQVKYNSIIQTDKGFAGYSESSIFSNCFWDIETSGASSSTGQGAGSVEGKTTAEMKMQATFTNAGWDFVGENTNGTEDIWNIDGTHALNDGYPYLSCNIYPVEPEGIGTYEDPYLIASYENLYWVSENSDSWGDYFIQTADILFTDKFNTVIGWKALGVYIGPDNWEENIPFSGIYDGNGHTISNLQINRPDADDQGLFGWIYGAQISNLGLINSGVIGRNNVGALVGRNQYGTVTNCYAICGVAGDTNVGGLLGQNAFYGSVTNSYSAGSVTGNTDTGGLIGSNWDVESAADSFWDTETSVQAYSAGGTAKTTAEMKTQATFTNWDFVSLWNIDGSTNSGYPYLRWHSYPLIPPQDLTIEYSANIPVLNWSSVSGATSYKIYSSTDPYADFPSGWTFEAEETGYSWNDTAGSETKKFYVIMAVK